MVLILSVAPIQKSIEESGGLMTIVTSPDNLVRWNTIFVGVGVFSFAFVCQHAAFLVSDSLERPTLQRWSLVSKSTMILTGILTMIFGVGGYLAYGDALSGDILKRLPSDSWITRASSLVLGVHMMLVYPMESFVARHICMLFQRLSRGDQVRLPHLNRIHHQAQPEQGYVPWTVGLYVVAMIPTILVGDVGVVLSIVGSITGSSLAYIAPGVLFLGCHGQAFLRLVRPHTPDALFSQASGDTATNRTRDYQEGKASESQPLLFSVSRTMSTTTTDQSDDVDDASEDETFFMSHMLGTLGWCLLGMPLWCGIAKWGSGHLRDSGKNVSYNDDSDNGMNVPTMIDFMGAIGFILFGTVALVVAVLLE